MTTKKKTIDTVIAIVGAFLLWAYVLNVVNPPISDTIRDVPVQLMHSDVLEGNKLAIAGDGYYTVDVVVEGPRAEFSSLTSADFTASADLTNVTTGQNYVTVDVTCSNSSVTIQEIHSQKIQVYADEFVEVEKPLNVACPQLDGDFEIAVLNLESETVVVSGAKSLVDLVHEVRVDVDASVLTIDKYIKQNLVGYALDKDGNIVNAVKLSNDEIGVTISKVAVKEVPLSVSYSGTPGLNASVSKVDAPKTIRIKGSGASLEKIKSISTDEINVDGITSNKTYNLVYHLPSGISLADSQTAPKATIILNDLASVSYEYLAADIAFMNLSDGLTVKLIGEEDGSGSLLGLDSIIVTASGNIDVVRSLTKESVTPAIDLSSIHEGQLKLALRSVYSGDDIQISISPAYMDVEVVEQEKSDTGEDETEEKNE